MKLIYILAVMSICFACQEPNTIPGQTEIEWDSDLGDFMFTTYWDYPEGIYKNDYGQLSCDGVCPPETDAMKDNSGRIYTDSLSAFYKLVDTTRQYHTMQSEAQCPEWGGANYMVATRSHDTIICNSLCNVATHSSLKLKIINNRCMASIILNSITGRDTTYILQNEYGYIKIDPELLKNGVLKSAFNLDFGHDKRSNKYIYWKGLIYTKISDDKALK